MTEAFRAYWSAQSTPNWERDTPEHYRLLAAELMLLVPRPPRRVLEIGCGSGDLFPYFGFDPARYVGVDFSPSMLARFRERHPELALHCADGAAYLDDGVYDLVLSNGVIQNFDDGMLDRHFANGRRMVAPDGVVICGSVPWRRHRLRFTAGAALGELRAGRWRNAAATAVQGPGFGRWYRCAALARAARRNGFTAEFYGSMSYMYRFHAVLTPL
jgi:SAM-dependent methyltransferase